MEHNLDAQHENPLDGENQPYVLRLYITGASTNSLKAVNNLKEICDTYLDGKYSLEIIDVYQQKALAKKENIIALPLLIKSFPLPEKRIVGDLSDTAKVLKGLGYSV
ncbi:circadian clock KaiB family protein [Dyadobacter sp. CY312]|uniref:circadian clock KaiB family protein n=1 Tax=Dyadobacter sp. CY312 TaxID=2907303 RepID=UPI001F46D120|nr:circadian clock KaiB family protein [Dyadobacter sp. CY312]MCE7040983.1 circadian clock KaiB family protein [Dyadobacter sp. CY312]